MLRYLLITIFILVPAIARAHDARPLLIQVNEQSNGVVELSMAAPASIPADDFPTVSLGPPCTVLSAGAPGQRSRAVYKCDGGIAGVEVDIAWPVYNPSLSALIRTSYLNGETRTALINPAETSWRAPAAESFAGVSSSYFQLGVSHIFGGIDHLLFLGGLLIIAGSFRRIVITASGFTLAHSVTLALVALNVISVSIPATETVIAFSIVFLATEIARGDKTTLAWRRPVLVASAFGLVHGAGFAAALGEVGLPQTEKVAALLFFNVGVETGQLLTILAAAFAMFTLRRFGAISTETIDIRRAEIAAAYVIGIVSAYWFLERLTAALLFV